MEKEPLLLSSPTPHPHTQSLPYLHHILSFPPQDKLSSSSSSSPDFISQLPAEGPLQSEQQQQQHEHASPVVLQKKKPGLHRCRTAPAMVVLDALKQDPTQKKLLGKSPSSSDRVAASILRQASVLLVMYLSLGVIVYAFNRDNFSGIETHPVVDALYFCIVTMCTIGYGDITPVTPATKVFACVFVLVGFGFIDILLSGVVNYVLDLQEKMILADINDQVLGRAHHETHGHGNNHHQQEQQHQQHQHQGWLMRNCMVDVEKGRMRIRWKVGLALGVVVLCIGMGSLVLYFVEHLSWVDSVYLAVLSVTTVGYGDRAFKTMEGRLFAGAWLLMSTLAVARAFLYLVEARVDKRQRSIAKWVLQREITPQDLLAANLNNNDFISKSEYVIYKLKEMGKIAEKDVTRICEQFSKIDPNNLGKITLLSVLRDRF